MQVLVSVSSVPEAHTVLSVGVKLIDLKDTSHGALAALDLDISKSIMEVVNAYRLRHSVSDIVVSATIGDDCASATALSELIQSRIDLGVDVIKLPETICANANYHTTIQTFLFRKVKLIAVLSPTSLSEQRAIEPTLLQLAKAGYWGVMVDTIHKSKSLTALLGLDKLILFVSTAKTSGLYVGLAGGLSLQQFDQLAELNPDYLGFRSGLCLGQRREQPLIVEKVQLLTTKLSEICCILPQTQ
jgi:uncharacterized protein (UPF0264 family)